MKHYGNKLAIMGNSKNGNQLPVMTSNRKKSTLLFKFIWIDALNIELQTNQVAVITSDNQSESEVMQ